MDFYHQRSYLKSHHDDNHLQQYHKSPHRRSSYLKLNFSLLLVLLATLIPLSLATSTCSRHEYYDMTTDQCVLCAKCNQHEIVIRPCQRHMDTVCKPLNSVEIDWSKSLATDRSSKHHPHHLQVETYTAEASTLSEDERILDWQMVSLVLAVSACLTFFVGTALISINYIRQWRKIKKEFDNGKFLITNAINYNQTKLCKTDQTSVSYTWSLQDNIFAT